MTKPDYDAALAATQQVSAPLSRGDIVKVKYSVAGMDVFEGTAKLLAHLQHAPEKNGKEFWLIRFLDRMYDDCARWVHAHDRTSVADTHARKLRVVK